MKDMLNKVTELHTYGKRYIIAKDSHGYWGISEDSLDKNGRLTKRLNGLEGHLSNTLSECIDMCRSEATMAYLMGSGLEFAEAAEILYRMQLAAHGEKIA